MKKLFAALSTILLLFALCSCNKTTDLYDRVSQVRTACYTGESNSFTVTAYSEMREYPLKADGYAGEMHDYIILKVQFKNTENALITGLSVDFSLDKAYSASMPYKAETDAYVAVVAVNELPENNFTVTITYDNESENVSLERSGNKTVSPTDALKVATDHKKALLGELTAKNADFEIMIRVMLESGKLYWYVGIVETEYTTALLISADGKVLAEKRLKNQ